LTVETIETSGSDNIMQSHDASYATKNGLDGASLPPTINDLSLATEFSSVTSEVVLITHSELQALYSQLELIL